VKINNWHKIRGIAYKGYCLVNPKHNESMNTYEVEILNLNVSSKPKWKLDMISRLNARYILQSADFMIRLYDITETKEFVVSYLNKRKLLTMTHFIREYEQLVDTLIEKVETAKQSK